METEEGSPSIEVRRGEMTITTARERMDVHEIHACLSRTYWAAGIPLEVVSKAIRHSLCFGMFDGEGRQVGFARVVTDYATFAYLCDVYVLETLRGQGLGKWLMEVVVSHPMILGLRRFLLATRDAQPLYAQYGFAPLPRPERFMQIHRPDVYRTGGE